MAATERGRTRAAGADPDAPADPRYLATTRAKRLSEGIPIPNPSPNWRPEVRSWFNALKRSGHSVFFEASDWATAVAAAQCYDRFLRSDNASILAQFVRLTERLGCTEIDRKKARIELTGAGLRDEDHEAASAEVISLTKRLRGK